MSNTSSGGISLASLLGCLFIALKLIGIIDWSWWWVLAPFWAGLALFLAVLFGGGLVLGVMFCIAVALDRKDRKGR